MHLRSKNYEKNSIKMLVIQDFSNITKNAPRFHRLLKFLFNSIFIQKNVQYSITCVTWFQTLKEKLL